MYIVFEGIDNSGKSTQINLVKERLELMFKSSNRYIEPDKIYTINEPELEEVVNPDDNFELILRFALQRRVLHKRFNPCIFKPYCNNIVISDRSFYSSYAYQGVSKTFLDYAVAVNSIVDVPQLVFFFDNGCDDVLLREAYNNYFNVLPLNTVYVDTSNHSISETTEYIADKILGKWYELTKDKL